MEGLTLLTRVRQWWSGLLTGRTAAPGAILFDELGVSLSSRSRGNESPHRIAWRDVGAVYAYKQDCYTVDQIRITFVDLGGSVRLAISEDDAGYQQLVEGLPRHLPGCLAPADWFQQVAFPAFETNWTELYRIPLAAAPDDAVVASSGRMAGSAAEAELRRLTAHLREVIPTDLKGSLRFWGEWCGRPHDNWHTLISCETEHTVLRLQFDQSETLSIWSPKGLTITRSGFRIAEARRVRWEWYAYGRAKTRENLYFKDFVRHGEVITAFTNIDWYNPSLNPDASKAAVELVNGLD